MHKRKIKYKEIKSKQKKDLNSKTADYYIYRHFSNPLTWVFVKLGVSPNAITISSFFICIIGFYFLSIGSYIFLLIGLIFFVLFKLLDMSDGEVARLQNKKSIEGVYFDRISHYIYAICLGIGIGIGLYRLYQSDIYIFLGFIFTLVFIIENTIHDLLKSLLRENIIRNKIDIVKSLTKIKQNIDLHLRQKLINKINGRDSWKNRNIISKVLGVYPFQGLIYNDTFTAPLLIIITLIEWITNLIFNFPSINGYVISIISLYIFIVSISKTIWIAGFILKIEKKRPITKTINEI